jgi:hypothetical protein
MFRRALITAVLPLTAAAQGTVSPDVDSVASGGYWEHQGSSGRYRVVVVNSGFEHVTSRVRVEWVRDARSSSVGSDVVASAEPELPFGKNMASLGATLKPVGKGRVRITVTGVMSHEPLKKVKAVLVATHPGQVLQ